MQRGMMNNLIITQTYQSSPFYRHCPTVSDLPANWRQTKLVDFPFKSGRLWCFARGGWIALLDDDDLILSSVFAEAATIAAKNPNRGAILCDWDSFDHKTGEIVGGRSGLIRLHQVCSDALACHQLVLVNCAAIPPACLEFAQELPMLWEWYLTASAILAAGAIHLPKVGYLWRQWPQQHHRRAADQFKKAADLVRAQLLKQAQELGRNLNLTIPLATIT